MGLAASQGRLLLLTARKSDLELQAQQISQERLLLSIQQESIATEYSDAINNQIYQIKPSGENEYVAMSVDALRRHYNGVDENTGATLTEGLVEGYENFQIKDLRTGKTIDLDKLAQADGSSDVPSSALQQNVLNGFWIVQTMDMKQSESGTDTQEADLVGGEPSFTSINMGGQNFMRQSYYTQDDGAAKARYDAATARIQRLDKQLELKLNQVETQHTAVETEIESVDKVISSNVESSFKYFS